MLTFSEGGFSLGEFDGYLDPPVEAVFFNAVPERGFKIVERGAIIPAPEGGNLNVEAIPRAGERGKKLLLPVGGFTSARNCYFEKDSPLFQRFADLKSEADIVSFASKYGQLCDSSLSWNGETIWLESLTTWETEISLMYFIMGVISDFEAKKDVGRYIERRGEEVVFPLRWAHQGKTTAVPSMRFIPSEEKRNTLYRGLVRFFNLKLGECPLIAVHSIREDYSKDPIRSFLEPLSLKGAVWLQFSQSFFRDGPNDIMARRDFLTGRYYPESELSLRTAGPHKGQMYHPAMKRRFYSQKHTRIEAVQEGKTVKQYRKGKTEFIVEEF